MLWAIARPMLPLRNWKKVTREVPIGIWANRNTDCTPFSGYMGLVRTVMLQLQRKQGTIEIMRPKPTPHMI